MSKRLGLIGLGLLGIILFILAAWQIFAVRNGLVVRVDRSQTFPITFITPVGSIDGSRPLVLIAHGFAGSGTLMRGFAYTLAYAGYATALWDFDGHAANPQPLSDEQGSRDLMANAETVLAEATALGIADTSRVAILGHSMGSGVALTFGQRYPQTAATIAVSPVGTSVTPVLPRNLLLMAGQNEAGFVRNAEQRLAEAGGSGGDFSAGSKRDLVIIPLVEHLTIVLAPATHQEARRWLDDTFGAQPDALDYRDIRIGWYGLGLVGALFASLALAPATKVDAHSTWDILPWWRRLFALVAGALGATLVLWGGERIAGVNLAQSFGLLVGGYLLVWFAIAGLIALLLLFDKSRWAWLDQVDWKTILVAVFIGAALWAGVGWLGSEIWLPWLLIPKRLILWPLGSLLILPWFLAMGQVSSPARAWGRLGWWLAQCGAVIGALVLALNLNSGLFFLLLILPVFPVILGAHALAAGRQRNPWAFGLSAALFISWSLIAVFPLQ